MTATKERNMTIFIVDDSDANLLVARDAIKGHYRVMTMISAAKLFELIKKIKPALILLDIEMPEMNGFQVMEKLKANPKYRDIPLVFLTGNSDPAIEAKGFELGATDFMTKPFSAPVLLNRIKHILHIEQIIEERTQEVRNMQETLILTLADMVERRDKATGGHVERTGKYMKLLLGKLIAASVYKEEILALGVEHLVTGSLLHDVGKIIVSDTILNKPGRLDTTEYESMQAHCLEGERIIEQITSSATDKTFLECAKILASTHHEKWDGTGYPRGLAGEDIPIAGRIMAVVDVYDALTSERSYKVALPYEEAAEMVLEMSGKHFDPKIAQVFYDNRALFVG